MVVILLFLALIVAAVLYRLRSGEFKSESFISMDTAVTIKVLDSDIKQYRDIVDQLDMSLDAYSKESELFKLNRSGQCESKVIADLLCELEKIDVVNTSPTAGRLIELWSIASDNARVPDDNERHAALETVDNANVSVNGNSVMLENNCYLNFGFCAKGYACDKIKEALKENGVECAVISLGSSSLLYGQKPDGESFKTAVTNPFMPSETILMVKTGECAISTSGGYERYSDINGKRYGHIFDLETGYPVETDLASVTVICDSALASDVLSTEIYIGGTDGLKQHLAGEDYQLIAVDKDKNVYATDSLKDSITITNSEFVLR